MRPLSVSASRLIVCSVALAASCAPRQTIVPVLEPVVTIEGEIAFFGSNPVEREIILSDAGGIICRLDGGRNDVELRSLAGLGARVTGRLGGKVDGVPEFLVDRYELLPIDGHPPVVGSLERRDGVLCLVEAERGGAYRLEGPLAKALAPFAGYKVWVAGETRSAREGGREIPLAVESYGVLLPPGSLIRSP